MFIIQETILRSIKERVILERAQFPIFVTIATKDLIFEKSIFVIKTSLFNKFGSHVTLYVREINILSLKTSCFQRICCHVDYQMKVGGCGHYVMY